ncbi:MAG TPA: aminoacetone oxidase family FAD-binding enzyme [Sphingobacteriaceae bacterium]|nr:aminoacetone oxidase family FAD-binding enzyme [Sphingobacteriaceae bacterium]
MADFDAIIIGGGACGLMCAAQAGLLGKRTLTLERNDRPGAKILISGGGRCNYTNRFTTTDNFVSAHAAFAETAFALWTVEDTVRFFEDYGIQGHEKTLGQLFPVTNKARDVVNVFTGIMRKTGQQLRLNTLVSGIEREASGFLVHILREGDRRETLRAAKIVLASGGLPVAKLGASDLALRAARDLGLEIIPTAPALVPLVITGKEADWYAALAGNTVFVRASNSRISFEEQALFTHWGLSGPAILQISSYWRPGESITLDLLPRHDVNKLIQESRQSGGKQLVSQLLQGHFSKRLLDALGQFLPLDLKIASLSKADAKRIADTLHRFTVKPATDKGYDKAEVMRGGVATRELDPQTLESLNVPGLYIGGEAVDMTGWLGGYNFQWAWASGYAIARAL